MRLEKLPIVYDEDIIIEKLRQGDRDTYRFLFSTYFKILCLYTTSLTKNRFEAEDIVQNVFLTIWRKHDEIIIKTSIKSYLYKAAYNMFINEYKKKRREETFLDQIHQEVLESSMVEEEGNIARKIGWINREIEDLPKKSKEIFIMNKKRGLSYKEIALTLNISENTVESHICRALKRIRGNVPKPFFFILAQRKPENLNKFHKKSRPKTG